MSEAINFEQIKKGVTALYGHIVNSAVEESRGMGLSLISYTAAKGESTGSCAIRYDDVEYSLSLSNEAGRLLCFLIGASAFLGVPYIDRKMMELLYGETGSFPQYREAKILRELKNALGTTGLRILTGDTGGHILSIYGISTNAMPHFAIALARVTGGVSGMVPEDLGYSISRILSDGPDTIETVPIGERSHLGYLLLANQQDHAMSINVNGVSHYFALSVKLYRYFLQAIASRTLERKDLIAALDNQGVLSAVVNILRIEG